MFSALNNEIELYDDKGRHLGALDPVTKQMIPNSLVEDREL